MVQTVHSVFEKFRCSAVFLEKIIDTTGTHTIPYTKLGEMRGWQKLSQRKKEDESGFDMKGRIPTPCGIY